MACSFLFLAFLTAAVAAPACLSAAAATAKLVSPSEKPSLSFGEGYTQLFGDSNLALHGGGKRVHISLDERTGGGHSRLCSLFCSRPIDGNACIANRVPCFVPGLFANLIVACSAPQALGSRRRQRTSTAASAPASSCPPTTPPASSSPSTYVSNPNPPPICTRTDAMFLYYLTNPAG